jgi:hypothetical protein
VKEPKSEGPVDDAPPKLKALGAGDDVELDVNALPVGAPDAGLVAPNRPGVVAPNRLVPVEVAGAAPKRVAPVVVADVEEPKSEEPVEDAPKLKALGAGADVDVNALPVVEPGAALVAPNGPGVIAPNRLVPVEVAGAAPKRELVPVVVAGAEKPKSEEPVEAPPPKSEPVVRETTG